RPPGGRDPADAGVRPRRRAGPQRGLEQRHVRRCPAPRPVGAVPGAAGRRVVSDVPPPRRWRRVVVRVATRGVVAVPVVAAVAVTAVAVTDRADLRRDAHARAHDAVVDLTAVEEGGGRVADLRAALRAADVARAIDDAGTVEVITALDELSTLQDRIALAEL